MERKNTHVCEHLLAQVGAEQGGGLERELLAQLRRPSAPTHLAISYLDKAGQTNTSHSLHDSRRYSNILTKSDKALFTIQWLRPN